ncbi:hypothetical protein [Collimonas pratensis]|uniref:Uncharacterized protein n=1 Tax=Collimonas pratensis TaxID=279113 RepID=A0ABM5Z929_9BURK|nr:hypothetical protein [Collimonas pratensis]AMP15526.1 hypothetical protein CPter291_3289 [Collimonas pratensis]
MMAFDYVRDHYGVPAELGRGVTVYGKPGVIAADRGHYIGVVFDADKPHQISNCHPTAGVEYGEIRAVPAMTRPQKNYSDFLQADWFHGTFAEWLGARKTTS